MVDDRYVKRLEEKIYSSKGNKSELCDIELRLFFNELIERKREDPIEGGLQAGMIILSDEFAAKINENDGSGLHSCTNINLVKYLNNDYRYYSDKAMRFPALYWDQTKVLSEEGVEIRILNGSEELMIEMSAVNNINNYQKEIIKKIISICKDIMDNYQKVMIGIHIPNMVIECRDLNDESYEDIMDILKKSNVKIKR